MECAQMVLGLCDGVCTDGTWSAICAHYGVCTDGSRRFSDEKRRERIGVRRLETQSIAKRLGFWNVSRTQHEGLAIFCILRAVLILIPKHEERGFNSAGVYRPGRGSLNLRISLSRMLTRGSQRICRTPLEL